MRRKDWADDEAERLYDMVRDDEDDDHVTAEIAKSLRKAAQTHHDEPVTGPVGDQP